MRACKLPAAPTCPLRQPLGQISMHKTSHLIQLKVNCKCWGISTRAATWGVVLMHAGTRPAGASSAHDKPALKPSHCWCIVCFAACSSEGRRPEAGQHHPCQACSRFSGSAAGSASRQWHRRGCCCGTHQGNCSRVRHIVNSWLVDNAFLIPACGIAALLGDLTHECPACSSIACCTSIAFYPAIGRVVRLEGGCRGVSWHAQAEPEGQGAGQPLLPGVCHYSSINSRGHQAAGTGRATAGDATTVSILVSNIFATAPGWRTQ